MAETDNIIIKDSLDGLGTDAYGNYLAHALCLAGSCKLKYNGEERQLQAGNLMILRKGKLVERIRPAEVMKLDAGQLELCRKDFEIVEERLAQTDHHFRRDLLITSVQLLIIDFFDFHSHLYGVDNIPLQSAAIMSRFLNMLENGTSTQCSTFHACCATSHLLSCASPTCLGSLRLPISAVMFSNIWA